MIRKILCKLGLHEAELEVVVRNGVNSGECGIFYEQYNKSIKAYIGVNLKCKHCGKYLGSYLAYSEILAKYLGLKEIKE